jgi:RNA polymerase sigma factor (sigma-70 family)
MPSDDAMLWAKFLAGDERAFERLFRTFYRDLYGYGLRLTNDEDLAKDGIQNLFQRLWHSRTKIGTLEAGAIRPYLFKALRNQLANEVKAQARRGSWHTQYSAESAFEVQYSPEDFLIAQELSAAQNAQLLAALDQLGNRQREAVYLKFFDGFTYERIAEIMALNPQSVRNLIYQSLKILKQNLPLPMWLLLVAEQLFFTVRRSI